MEKNKIVFIVDGSQQYLDSEVRRVCEEWGLKTGDIKQLNQWTIGCANVKSLFSKPQAVLLNLTEGNSLKDFVQLISSDKIVQNSFKEPNWFGSGVIIIATKAQGISKIEKLVNSSGGTIKKKRKPEEVKKELLDKINVPHNLKSFLYDYVGRDYEQLLNCIKNINLLDDSKRKSLTMEELLVYLPRKKGSIPPWEFSNEMIKGVSNTTNTLDKLRRTLENDHPLIALTFIKKKINDLYYNQVLIESGVTSYEERAEILNINKWVVKNMLRDIHPNLSTLENLSMLIADKEQEIKGDKYIHNLGLEIELLVTKIILGISYNLKY